MCLLNVLWANMLWKAFKDTMVNKLNYKLLSHLGFCYSNVAAGLLTSSFHISKSSFFFFFFNFYFYFILLYNTVLVLPYIDMNLPRVYMSSQSWTPLPPPTPYHLCAVQGPLKSLLQHHSSKTSILRCSAFFMVQLSHLYTTTGKTIALTVRTLLAK